MTGTPSTTLTFDIECVASRAPHIARDLQADPDSDVRERAALYGSTAEVVCVSYAYGDDRPTSIVRALDAKGRVQPSSERQLLAHLLDVLQTNPPKAWVGHGIRSYDVPVLWQRCVANGLVKAAARLLPLDTKPWDTDTVQDTVQMWSRGGRGGASLHRVCMALGVPSPKVSVDGSGVEALVDAGNLDAVAAYCEGDVTATRSVYRILRGWDDPASAAQALF